jgi:hypothetical protein
MSAGGPLSNTAAADAIRLHGEQFLSRLHAHSVIHQIANYYLAILRKRRRMGRCLLAFARGRTFSLWWEFLMPL